MVCLVQQGGRPFRSCRNAVLRVGMGCPTMAGVSASGEIYDQDKLTAAHRTLPFGTRVRVRRLDRDRSVVVRINDRGPFVKSRIIDLSRAAAVTLGITDGGAVSVVLEVLETPPVAPHHNRMFKRAAVKRVPRVDTSGAAQ